MKKALINNLYNDVYCRIQQSKTHGVGVFAIKDIPEGVNPFRYSGNNCFNQKIIDVPEKDLKNLDIGVKKMIHDFYHKNEDGIYSIPQYGLNSQEISFYINASKTSNVGVYEDNKCTLMAFKTKRKIKKGEKLFINYDDYNE
jgi:SET domain